MELGWSMSHMSKLLLVWIWLQKTVSGEIVIQRLEENIGAENFTYYRLHRTGSLRLELLSVLGDVDIYISTESQHPTYSVYDLKSETCGLDVISIPSDMARPVFIGLFGHPNYLQSRYQLSIFEENEPVVDDYESYVARFERYYFDDLEKGFSEDSAMRGDSSPLKSHSTSSPKQGGPVEEQLPLWWKILLGILEFGIEVIL